ncbi:hypothetical protein H8F23_28520 [Pseudomonas sp. P155]|uniref:Ig-like domain repeat protein n=1 Tax=Pseudomonas neuropathica TaxID=2730425 RepID=A0ABS0BSA9_9PSED|nr:hypothetical protein [Pseudomonas neuropathica]MBF6037214.1 hypothetical protein [Pseudomonas neuropathica]
MSAKDQPDNAPLILKELKIPGRTKDPVCENPKVWGINRAAALDNFPRQGLLCQAGPWSPMNRLDKLVIYKDKSQEILPRTVDEDEIGTELQMFVEARHITEGTYTLSYSVTRLGQTPEPSEEMQVLVKLTRPGGEDHSEDPGHPDLVMTIPEEILKGGIDKENVNEGVPITIGNADGKPPYPFAAAGDVIRVSWGGVFVLSAPLTQAQADGTVLIVVNIDEATIRKAGDSDDSGLAVVFEVYDLVDNRSSDWSVEQRVLVAVDKLRLVAPLLKEALNNVLDVDKLGDANGTAQVWVSGSSFKVGDTPILTIKGTPQEGPPVDIEVPGEALVSVPTTHETKIANSILRQLAKSQIALSYRLKKADGSADLPAKTQFISVIGEVQRLEAPEALDAKHGAIDPLDPELKQVRIEIPFDAAFLPGQTINLFWLGTRPDLDTYLPSLPLRPITKGDYDAKEPLLILVDKKHLTPIIGGTLELYYQLQIEDSVFNQMNRFDKTRAIRESKHADILQIGEPRQELPEPKVEGVVNGVLPPDTNGTHLIMGYLKTVKGDEVIYQWEGSKTGVHSDSLKLTDVTAGQPVSFTIKAEWIKGNEGGTVEASYEIKRAAGGTSYSDTLTFSVGVALDLKEPKIKQAPNDTSLDPLDAQSALTAVIDYDGMLVGDKIIVRWIGATGTLPAGSHTTDTWPVTTVGPQEIPLAVSVIAFNLDKSITLDYSVTRGTQDPKDSRTRTLAVLPIAQSHLPKPLIVQASEAGEGRELDVSQMTTNATFRVNSYPHIALKQYVWFKAKATLKGGGVYSKTFWQPPGSQTNATWINQGFYTHAFPLADLQSLEDGSDLELEFKAGFGGTQVESEAVTFALRTYKIKAYENIVPTLDSVKGSTSGDDIPHGSTTVETALTLRGTATPNTKIDLANNGVLMPNTEVQVDSRGEWTFQLTGLVAETTYKLNARRKDGTLSNARDVVVVALVVPTLTSVKGSPSGLEIPQNGITVETAVTLSGIAAKGQQVEIFDVATPVGKATADSATGIWELPVTSLRVAAHSFKAKALYGTGAESAARTLTVTAATAPTLTSVEGSPSGDEIPQNGTTVETAVTLSGVAAKGQQVEIFDVATPIGKATADSATGKWELAVTGLRAAAHSFKGKALYAPGLESIARTFTVIVVGGYEDWKAEPRQEFLTNMTIQLKSGLELTALELPSSLKHIINPWISARRYEMYLCTLSKTKFKWAGSVTNITLVYTEVLQNVYKIRFYDSSGVFVDEQTLPISGFTAKSFDYKASSGRHVSYFEIWAEQDSTGDHILINNVRWFN